MTAEQASALAKDFAERLERDLPRLVVSRMTKSPAPGQGPHRLVAEQRLQDHGRALLAARQGAPHRLDPGHLGRGRRLPRRWRPVLHRPGRAGPRRGARRPVRPAQRLTPRQVDLAAALGHQQQRVGGEGGGRRRSGRRGPSPRTRPCCTHACRRPSSSGSRSGSPWVSSVASQCSPYWFDMPCATASVPRRVSRAGPQPGLLGELGPRQLLRGPACRPAGSCPAGTTSPPAERVAVLLDQVETAVLGRDDQREVVALDDRVGSPRPVGSLDLVPAQPCPVIGIDDAARKRPDLGLRSAASVCTAPFCPPTSRRVKRPLPKMVDHWEQQSAPNDPSS